MKKKISWYLVLMVFALLWNSCETNHHDYIYNLKISTTDSVQIVYKINGEKEAQELIVGNGDLIRLCKRADVSGEDIWDIETGSTIYKVESLVAYSLDSAYMTENLNRRNYWSASPQIVGDSAYYTIELTDKHFILSQVYDYRYFANSSAEDSVVVTCIMGGNVFKDTLFGSHNSSELGITNIYAYNENATKSEKDKKTQLLSGISSLSLKLKKDGKDFSRTINLQKEDSLFTFSDKECSLLINETIFDTNTTNNRK